MDKDREEYVTAVDGLEAFDKYQAAPESFKVIFMGMNLFYICRFHCSWCSRYRNASDGRLVFDPQDPQIRARAFIPANSYRGTDMLLFS